MPSITSWTRLEPRARSAAMQTSLQARVHDPLWLLARQWQFGEFLGEDVGSPVFARLEAERSQLTRYFPGRPDGDVAAYSQVYDSRRLPLETLVEGEPGTQSADAGYRFAVEAGLHFFRLLGATLAERYREAYLELYPIPRPEERERRDLDGSSLRFLDVVAGRVPHGALLYADLNTNLRPDSGQGALPADPPILTNDRQAVMRAASAWLAWYDAFYGRPAGGEQPWVAERMEYEFAVSAPTSEGELVLVAPEYTEGHLDWHSFVADPSAGLGAAGQTVAIETIRRTVLPTPVRFRGMPSARYWEFEDAQTSFGSVEAAPEDLARLLLMEFVLLYSNDFFHVPIDLPVGSVCRTNELVVTNTFGETTRIDPATAVDGAGASWRMFQLATNRRAGEHGETENIFFLPPVLGTSLESTAIEEVLLLRDEMANMAWAVERIVESPTGEPLDRFEAYQERRRRQERAQEEASPGSTAPSSGPLAYRLATSIPDYWIPLVPVQTDPPTSRSVGLQRRAMLHAGTLDPITPLGRILEPGEALILNEEEVPRAGARVTRSHQYARWIDGSTHLWVGRRKEIGRGESSSGLRFDVVEPS